MKHSMPAAALLCLLLGPATAHEQYQVVTEEWAPYNYVEHDQLTGMTTEIVRAIMALTGDKFEVLLQPSMRATQILKNRPKTIMYSLFRTPEREPLYKWVGPIVEESIHAYQLASAPPINSLEQLLHAPQITTRHAGLVPQTLQSLGFNNLDKSATESKLLYRMLLAGRTSIIVGDTAAGVAYYSRQLEIPPGTLRQIPIELYRSSLYIAFSTDSDDELIAAWNRALEQLRRSGELSRIQRRYEQQPAQPE
ncbi:transporter substrate-binding domain-containing protein [Pseudomonas alvandae]|uniref:Transporter substrate-binding domain-containing protein n=2 Tax=Pseudomonas canavaninivorans TaxID=2842348 RepID=A0ABX8Q6S8_PSECO|nr:transporter substrate-binding domain-containing protein [Pseudomonas alvandae]QXI51081.1 transporter substrate-binding domain-containing protein [Pseudomonas alvandae]